MLETLSLSNMGTFKSLYKESRSERSYDKDFFTIYNKENIFMKYIYRRFVKLIKYNESFIGFIWYEAPSEKYVKVLALYINPEYKKYIKADILKELDKHILCYEEYNTKDIILNLLGFEPIMTTFMMYLELSNTNFKYLSNDLLSNKLEIRNFLIGKDEELRCKLQNDIFYEEDRKPLSIEDIYSDMVQDYYLKNHCYFLSYNNEYIGYGQIIKNRGFYTLVNFGVLEEYRRLGFGTLFIKYIIDICKNNNINDLYIRVDEENNEAIKLYKKIGFNILDEIFLWQRN